MMRKHGMAAAGLGTSLALILMVVTSAVFAEERPVHKSGPADPDGHVRIENIAGSITVEGWDREEVQLDGVLGDDVEDLEFESGAGTRIEVVYPRHVRNIDEGADLTIKVPRGSRVEIDGVSCTISVEKVTGAVFAASVSGQVTVSGTLKEVSAETISGDLDLDVDCPEVSAKSISGEILVRGRILKLGASTVSGDLDLAAERFIELDLQSVTGDVDVAGDLDPSGSFTFDLHGGDLTLSVPGSLDADLEIETFTGDIEDDFGGKVERSSAYGPGKEMFLTLGAGKARVRISSFSGDVTIRKR
ncbi:MAG: DUF4097 family beta strand repeat-containing protein [bacterium]